MPIDFDALRTRIQTSSKVLYQGKGRTGHPFFNIWDDHHKQPDGTFSADVRLVVKPDTKGFGYRVVHKKVGYPTKDPKNFVCPKAIASENECVLCDAYMLHKDPDFDGNLVSWHEPKDREMIKKTVPITDIFKLLAPTPRLVIVVCEPALMNRKDLDPKYAGPMIFFIEKISLMRKFEALLKPFPPSYFTDPAKGPMLRFGFNPRGAANDMYSVVQSMPHAIPEEMVDNAPDPEEFTGKVKSSEEMEAALREMLPSLDW